MTNEYMKTNGNKIKLAIEWFKSLSDEKKVLVFEEALLYAILSGFLDVAVEDYEGEFKEEEISWVNGEVYHKPTGDNIV